MAAGSAASSAASERAVDHMIFKLAGIVFAHRPAASRLTGLVHRLATAGDQIMPVAQRLAGGAQTIGTGSGEPIEPVELHGVELHAIGNKLQPVLVIDAAPVSTIEQLAGDIRRVELTRLFVFEFVDAAAAAAVAQGLPLPAVERGERPFPEWRCTVHFTASLALLSPANQGHHTADRGLRS